jgi:WD40 repeat protein
MERSLVGTPCIFIAGSNADIWRSEQALTYTVDQNKPGEIWAIAISADGQYLAGSSINGKVNVWSLNKAEGMPKIREYETKGSFGLCVDLVRHNCFSSAGPYETNTLCRAVTEILQHRDTRMVPSTSSTMRPVVFLTP